ncbi:hypothetical protein AQUCO_00700734v1 [Aquilegia coerulea]|uniref:Uncharacterized protein n=1 Tax=Aquilegia coerulea TaxID=218851 RepID=A0A2G5ELI7_AQUCA|nr:hypothetical protein AQUCO_00700734v1 [Aquilegia coerulea]
MAVWSQLPDDLLSFIGMKLDILADRCRFRSVCKSWRCCLPPFAQPPLLMLSLEQQPPPESTEEYDEKYEYEGDDDDDEEEKEKNKKEDNSDGNPPLPLRGFVGIGGANEHDVVYKIELPEAHLRRCVGSTGNWIITIDKSGLIYLLNPFSRVQINLPRQSKFEYKFIKGSYVTPEIRRDSFTKKIILSSAGSSESNSGSINKKKCIAMAIHHWKQKLAIARPDDASWTTVHTPGTTSFVDIIFYKEHFYAVSFFGMIVVCDIDVTNDDPLHKTTPKASVVTENWLKLNCYKKIYLVEWMGELLLVIKFVEDLRKTKTEEDRRRKILPFYKTEKFELYKLDFANKKWEEVNNLEEYCLFLGDNTSVSIFANDYSLKKNCIYFTDDFTHGYRGTKTPGGLDMGVFDLEDKSIQPHYKSISTCYYSPPIWIIPTSFVK